MSARRSLMVLLLAALAPAGAAADCVPADPDAAAYRPGVDVTGRPVAPADLAPVLQAPDRVPYAVIVERQDTEIAVAGGEIELEDASVLLGDAEFAAPGCAERPR